MLRRKLTRIQLSRDDIEEYETIKRERLAKNKAETAPVNLTTLPARSKQSHEERIAEVQRRIGYQPENVSSDGTQRMM